MSGDDADFRRMSTEKIAYIHKIAGKKLVVIGVGGVKDAKTALDKLKAGAKMVQVVTGLRGEGLAVAHQINKGLIAYMNKNKLRSLSEINQKIRPKK